MVVLRTDYPDAGSPFDCAARWSAQASARMLAIVNWPLSHLSLERTWRLLAACSHRVTMRLSPEHSWICNPLEGLMAYVPFGSVATAAGYRE